MVHFNPGLYPFVFPNPSDVIPFENVTKAASVESHGHSYLSRDEPLHGTLHGSACIPFVAPLPDINYSKGLRGCGGT